jgi:broad specificity phosphatase PhoE
MKILFMTPGEIVDDDSQSSKHKFDLHLSDAGASQIVALTHLLVERQIQLIYHSPQMCAVESAKLFSKRLLLPLKQIENFAQMNARDSHVELVNLKGTQYDVKEQSAADVVAQPSRRQITEDEDLFKLRVANAFAEILSVTKYKSIAVITHNDFLACLLKEYLKLGEIEITSPAAYIQIIIENDTVAVEDMQGIRIKRFVL